MFEVRIVVALALVCLQVSSTPLDVYKKLGECFKNGSVDFFKDFYPYNIKELPFESGKFIGSYRGVKLFDLKSVTINGELLLPGYAAPIIGFNNTFTKINVQGDLEGSVNGVKYEGPATGYAKEVKLEGGVLYDNGRVILEMNVTVGYVSIKFKKGKTPFKDKDTTNCFQTLFSNMRKDIEQESRTLIESMINTNDKIDKVIKECNIEV